MVRRCVLAAALVLAAHALEAHAEKVDAAALAEARRSGEAAVVVLLRAAADTAPESGAARRARLAEVRRRVVRRLSAGRMRMRHAYRRVPGFAAAVSAAGLELLDDDPDVVAVGLDGEGGGALATSVPQIGADRVRQRGVSGAGTVIAVLDTGVESTHPDVAGALLHEECFCGGLTPSRPCCPDGSARQSGPGAARSLHEHGIHVTGIALSSGTVAPLGVAPGARLVSVKVLNDSNRGVLSDWLAGLDWILDQRSDVRVVNMSLASDRQFPDGCETDCAGDPLCPLNVLFADAIAGLRARGTLVFVAAGNDGATDRLGSPACVTDAVSVGAVDDDDRPARFGNGSSSNTSPGLDLLAPGVQILSDGLEGGLAILSGTSMASPHAAGTAALLFSARPGAGADEVLSLLRATGRPVFDSRNGEVFPRVDAAASFREITRQVELARGGGGREMDCMLEWNFIPSDVLTGESRPVARCRDGDRLCDTDGVTGRCTFALSLCFNFPDPLLRSCAVDEILTSFEIGAPRGGEGASAIERANREVLHHALPAFPLDGSSICTDIFPFVVERPPGANGIAYASMGIRSATRRDYDSIALICEAP